MDYSDRVALSSGSPVPAVGGVAGDAQPDLHLTGLPTQAVTVDELEVVTAEHIRTLIDVDLQTFSEPTFSPYTASLFLQNGRVFALRVGGEVVGTAVYMRCWSRPSEANLLSMGILPGFRGQRYGQCFVIETLARLRRTGVHAVTLMVARGNRRALKVYTDAGFAKTPVRFEDPRTGEVYVQLRVQLREPTVSALPQKR